MNGRRIISLMALEMAAFALLPALFLCAYILHFNAPAAAVVRHSQWIVLFWVTLVALRAALRLPRVPRGASLWLSSFLIAAFFAILGVYYVLVCIGMKAWGKVISLELILTYSAQAKALAGVIGLSLALTAIVAAATFASLWLLCAYLLRRFDWVGLLHARLPSHMSLELTAACAFIALVGLWHMASAAATDAQEPITLTLHPISEEMARQSYAPRINTRLTQQEADARAAYQPAVSAVKRNVILIVVDALRRDHMSLNGYSRPTTPNLERRSGRTESMSASRMYSVCAESACGLMGIASSRFSHQTPGKPLTVQEILMLHGYRAHMILGGDHTSFYGLKEAYGPVNSYYDGSMAKGYYMNDDQLVIDRLKGFPNWQGEPTFMQFHLMSAHGLGQRSTAFERFLPAKNPYAEIHRPDTSIPPDPQAINFYDNGVLQADDVIESLLNILQEKGYLKNALVVITADHGDLLGEHGEYTHAKTVYEAVLDIPFIMIRHGYSLPEILRKNTVASQVDIAPTILAELNIPPPATWQGIALQKIARPSQTQRYLFFQEKAEYGLYDLHQENVLWKYRADAKRKTEAAFEVLSDRGEARNLLSGIPADIKQSWLQNLLEPQVIAYDKLGLPDPKSNIPKGSP